MSARPHPSVSRREMGKIAVGATAGILAALVRPGTVGAEGSARPVFIKDESGVSFYDIKTGTGSGPIDGDFVIIDYVRGRLPAVIQKLRGFV